MEYIALLYASKSFSRVCSAQNISMEEYLLLVAIETGLLSSNKKEDSQTAIICCTLILDVKRQVKVRSRGLREDDLLKFEEF